MSRIVPAEAARRVPWKNGRGTTLELATDAGIDGDWSWRLSIADVPERAVFSEHAGVDRQLLCLDGPGLRLHRRGGTQDVPRDGDAVLFLGEEPVEGEPLGPGVRDVGLMLRRDRWRGKLRLFRARPFDVAGELVLVHVPAGSRPLLATTEDGPVEIPPGGTLIAEGPVAAFTQDAAVVSVLTAATLYVKGAA